jgi:hypothetical protein
MPCVRLPPDGLPNNPKRIAMKTNDTSPPALVGRIIGLDLHPDVFSAAALSGRDAATAQVEPGWERRPTVELESWARGLRPGDVVVLEAGGNTFTGCERLQEAGAKVVVLESQRAGQIRTSYCANDRLDAVKLMRLLGVRHIIAYAIAAVVGNEEARRLSWSHAECRDQRRHDPRPRAARLIWARRFTRPLDPIGPECAPTKEQLAARVGLEALPAQIQ